MQSKSNGLLPYLSDSLPRASEKELLRQSTKHRSSEELRDRVSRQEPPSLRGRCLCRVFSGATTRRTPYRTVLGGIVRDQRQNEAVAEDVDKDEEKDDPKLPRHCANNEVARGGSWGAVDECGYATGPQRCAARDGLLGG